MAVYEQTYRRYTGPVTPAWERLLILPRYALGDVFKSKLFVAFFSLCFAYPLFCAAAIYLLHNADLLLALDADIGELVAIDADYFRLFVAVQGTFAFLTALFIGPGLVSRDLANNGLPLYLYRPFSRWEYVLGKFLVLGLLLSAVTWVPGLLLFLLKGTLAGGGWVGENARIAFAIFTGSWVWIGVVSLLALAFSAWVRWRPVAGFLMLFVIFSGSAFSFLFNELFDTTWGSVINLQVMIYTVWSALFGLATSDPPAWAAAISLVALGLFCLFLLHRKIRAYEVVS